MNQPKSQNQIKMRFPNRYGEARIPTYQNGCKNSEENLVDERVPEHRDSHASCSHEPSLEPMRSVDLCKYLYSLPERPKLRDLPEDQHHKGFVQSYLVQTIFGETITADHKVLREGCESRDKHRYAVVVQDLAAQWIQSYPNKKTSKETHRSLQKFLEPSRKPKVIYTDRRQCWRRKRSTPKELEDVLAVTHIHRTPCSSEFGRQCLRRKHCAPTGWWTLQGSHKVTTPRSREPACPAHRQDP